LLTLENIIEATGGRALTECPKRFKGVSTDSRATAKGELFVPLSGERFDGHDFIEDVLKKGAAGSLVQAGRKTGAVKGGCLIEVPDTLRALQDIAAWIRRSRRDTLVIGVTGTNGKTTTKEMLASVLSVKGPVLKNEGNLNNHIGLPLTLMGLRPEHWAAVLEMGMSAEGEIARLAEIAMPSVGIITNIGPAHLLGLGSMDAIVRAKGELVDALPDDGRAVLNSDDPYLKGLIEKNKGRAVTFGLGAGATITAEDIRESVDGVSFKLVMPGGRAAVSLPVMGAHNVVNALAAAGAAWCAGMSVSDIKAGLDSFSPAKMRMEVVEVGGARVINDAYNANPASMAAALTALASVKDCRRIAVLGDMLELGDAARISHHNVGRLAGAEGLSLLVLMGAHAEDTAEGAAEAGMDEDDIVVASGPEEAAAAVAGRMKRGDCLLLKGSRGMRMERIIELLKHRRLSA